jgi:hypothetical protein
MAPEDTLFVIALEEYYYDPSGPGQDFERQHQATAGAEGGGKGSCDLGLPQLYWRGTVMVDSVSDAATSSSLLEMNTWP